MVSRFGLVCWTVRRFAWVCQNSDRWNAGGGGEFLDDSSARHKPPVRSPAGRFLVVLADRRVSLERKYDEKHRKPYRESRTPGW